MGQTPLSARLGRFLELIYELTIGVGEAFAKLLPMAVVNEDEHSEASRDASGAIISADLNWVKPGNRQHKSWDNTVLGKLHLESGRLVADVNSARRAERLKREIAKRLAKGAALIETTVVDPAEALAERACQRAEGMLPDAPEPEPSPELQAMQETLERQHWAEWLDTRVPALGNKTPRQDVRTSGGRERLEALLAGFEREAEAHSRGMREHLANLRRGLGLSKPPA